MTRKNKKLGVKISPKSGILENEIKLNDAEELDKTPETDEDKSELSTVQKQDAEKLSRINRILDKLTLEMLLLMEQFIDEKQRIETLMTEGEVNLAKCRYIMGHKNVSSLQLPTELSNDIDPSVTLEEVDNDERYFGQPLLSINVAKVIDENDEKNVQDPKRWFGVLVPRNLNVAQTSFKNALSVVVDCANTQTRLNRICLKIQQVRELRNRFNE